MSQINQETPRLLHGKLSHVRDKKHGHKPVNQVPL